MVSKIAALKLILKSMITLTYYKLTVFLCLWLILPAIPIHGHSATPKSVLSPRFESAYSLPDVFRYSRYEVEGLASSHNGRFVAYFTDTYHQCKVIVHDLATRKVIYREWRDLGLLAVSSNGTYLAITGSEGKLTDSGGHKSPITTIVNMETKKVLRVPGPASAIAFSPDSRHLVIAGNQLASYDVITGRKIYDLPHSGQITTLMFSPNEKLLAADSNGGIGVWDIASRRLIQELKGANTPIVFSSDSRLLATNTNDPEPEPDALPPDSYPESARFAFQDYAIKLWNLSTGKSQILKHAGRQIEKEADPKAFSLDGRLLLSTNGDLWNVQTLKFIGRSESLSKQGREIRFSRSGSFIVAEKKSKR